MKFFLHILFVISPLFLFAQNKVTVSKSDFLIGEQTTIYYEITNFKRDAEIDFNPWKNVIICEPSIKGTAPNELEILFFRDTIIRASQSELIGAYTVTAWDTGIYIIPPHSILVDEVEYLFESVKLNVFLPPTKEGDEIIESELPFQDYKVDPFYQLKQYLPWIIGALIVLILVIWFFVKRTKKNKNEVASYMPLLERILREIESLSSEKLIEQQKTKEHYIKSSFIFRRYLGEKFDLNVLEKTSSQTRILLIAKGLPSDIISEIQRLFNLFDSVKFAKFNPEISESQEILNQLKNCILEINNWSQSDVK